MIWEHLPKKMFSDICHLDHLHVSGEEICHVEKIFVKNWVGGEKMTNMRYATVHISQKETQFWYL